MEIIVQDALMEPFMTLKLKNVFLCVGNFLLMTIQKKYVNVYLDMESLKMLVVSVQHHSLFKITIVLLVPMMLLTMLILKDVYVIVDSVYHHQDSVLEDVQLIKYIIQKQTNVIVWLVLEELTVSVKFVQ